MGNVNGREEEGAISPSSGDGVGFGEGESNNSSEVMVASDESHVTYPAQPPEMMGQSPPHSPRASHSPLMFTPQVLLLRSFCFWLLLFVIHSRVLRSRLNCVELVCFGM